MRILLTGRGGQLGRALQPLLSEWGDVVAIDRDDVDFAAAESLNNALERIQPRLIVNTAAFTNVDGAETAADTAFAANAVAPEVLARWAERTGSALVHYSTDYVFDGSGVAPWREDDAPAPLNVYGKSKLAGDRAVLDSKAYAIILRTSWVYDAEGQNFLRTMLRLGAEREELAVVDDQIGAPTPAYLLAEITANILRQADDDFAKFLNKNGGVVNATASGATSWHGFAEAIFEDARRRGWPLRINRVRGIPTTEYPLPATRPLNSRLDLRELARRFEIAPLDWRSGLRAIMDSLPPPAID